MLTNYLYPCQSFTDKYFCIGKCSTFITSHPTHLYSGTTDMFCTVTDLCSLKTGMRVNYEQFCIKHNFQPLKSEFTKLHRALPQQFVFLIRNNLAFYPIQPQLAPIQGISVLDRKCTNHFIRNCFTEYLYLEKQNKNNIIQKFDKATFTKLRTMYITLPIPSSERSSL